MKLFYNIAKYSLILIALFVAVRLLNTCLGSGNAYETKESYRAKIDSLNLVNSALIDYKNQLTAAINMQTLKFDSLQKVKQRLKPVYLHAKSDRSLINGDSLNDVAIFDNLVVNCDSMNLINDSIITAQITRDSTYIELIRTQEKQIAIKDTTIGILKTEIVNDEAEIKKLNKKVKRNRILAIGSAILSGVGFAF